MKPRVTLRQALDDPSLLGAALAGPSWHAWRSLLLAAMGESLQPDELDHPLHWSFGTTFAAC
jgi:hypothetical protein